MSSLRGIKLYDLERFGFVRKKIKLSKELQNLKTHLAIIPMAVSLNIFKFIHVDITDILNGTKNINEFYGFDKNDTFRNIFLLFECLVIPQTEKKNSIPFRSFNFLVFNDCFPFRNLVALFF